MYGFVVGNLVVLVDGCYIGVDLVMVVVFGLVFDDVYSGFFGF